MQFIDHVLLNEPNDYPDDFDVRSFKSMSTAISEVTDNDDFMSDFDDDCVITGGKVAIPLHHSALLTREQPALIVIDSDTDDVDHEGAPTPFARQDEEE